MTSFEEAFDEALDELSDLIWVQGFGTLVDAAASELGTTSLRVRAGGDFGATYRIETHEGRARAERDLVPSAPVQAEISWDLRLQDVSDAFAGVDVLARALQEDRLDIAVSEQGRRNLKKLIRFLRELDWHAYFENPGAAEMDHLVSTLSQQQERRTLGLPSGRHNAMVALRAVDNGKES